MATKQVKTFHPGNIAIPSLWDEMQQLFNSTQQQYTIAEENEAT